MKKRPIWGEMPDEVKMGAPKHLFLYKLHKASREERGGKTIMSNNYIEPKRWYIDIDELILAWRSGVSSRHISCVLRKISLCMEQDGYSLAVPHCDQPVRVHKLKSWIVSASAT